MIYIYRYNTVLVNKVEGFHIADRGTELRFYVSPNMLNEFKFLLFFLLFPSCSHLISIHIGIINVLYTHSSQACTPQ